MKFSEDVEMEGVRLVGSGHITVPGDGGMALSSENSGVTVVLGYWEY